MKAKKIIGYICVSILMLLTGTGTGIALGSLMDLAIYLMGHPLTWYFATMTGIIMGLAFFFATFGLNPVADFMEKFSKCTEGENTNGGN